MLLVQRFHSIHDIDPEFIPDIEELIKEEMTCFDVLVHFEDSAPEETFFTYFLFFTSHQNTPIGISVLRLTALNNQQPWYRKIFSTIHHHKHTEQPKHLAWKIGNGSSGACLFQPNFSRQGNEKFQAVISEYQSRNEIGSEEIYSFKGLQDFKFLAEKEFKSSKDLFVLEPLIKVHSDYQDYLNHLDEETMVDIKNRWKKLHTKENIHLGDYDDFLDVLKKFDLDSSKYSTLKKFYTSTLTFEKDEQIRGLILYRVGHQGNIFFEPLPLEKEKEASVSDELYIQYALLKFFELTDGKKCHLIKDGAKLIFENKKDLQFFTSQGFQFKTITRFFQSNMK